MAGVNEGDAKQKSNYLPSPFFPSSESVLALFSSRVGLRLSMQMKGFPQSKNKEAKVRQGCMWLKPEIQRCDRNIPAENTYKVRYAQMSI